MTRGTALIASWAQTREGKSKRQKEKDSRGRVNLAIRRRFASERLDHKVDLEREVSTVRGSGWVEVAT